MLRSNSKRVILWISVVATIFACRGGSNEYSPIVLNTPVISIETPAALTVNSTIVSVRGTVESLYPIASVKVGEVSATALSSDFKSFEATVQLFEDDETDEIEIVATDTRGFVGTRTLSLTLDAKRPTVSQMTPTDGVVGVTQSLLDFSVTFSEPMNRDTIESGGIVLKNEASGLEIAGAISYEDNDIHVVFTPAGNLPSGTQISFTATTAAEDLAGNGLASDVRIEFTTGVSEYFSKATLTGTLTVKVHDAFTGAAIAGAIVSIGDLGTLSGTTLANGSVKIDDTSLFGTQSITVAKSGYVTRTILGVTTDEVTLALRPNAVSEIAVSGTISGLASHSSPASDVVLISHNLGDEILPEFDTMTPGSGSSTVPYSLNVQTGKTWSLTAVETDDLGVTTNLAAMENLNALSGTSPLTQDLAFPNTSVVTAGIKTIAGVKFQSAPGFSSLDKITLIAGAYPKYLPGSGVVTGFRIPGTSSTQTDLSYIEIDGATGYFVAMIFEDSSGGKSVIVDRGTSSSDFTYSMANVAMNPATRDSPADSAVGVGANPQFDFSGAPDSGFVMIEIEKTDGTPVWEIMIPAFLDIDSFTIPMLPGDVGADSQLEVGTTYNWYVKSFEVSLPDLSGKRTDNISRTVSRYAVDTAASSFTP
ncbi:MAG: Ig-like domain-containing protein [Planctomycetes bacterium]|nr:Ig-like domain-containing protein [Planctomycetota bacterium]